jgi:hypothetical protein
MPSLTNGKIVKSPFLLQGKRDSLMSAAAAFSGAARTVLVSRRGRPAPVLPRPRKTGGRSFRPPASCPERFQNAYPHRDTDL